MIELTEPQVWTVIGVFGSVLIGMLTLMSTTFVRILRAEIGSVRAEIGSVRTEVSAEVGSLRREMDASRAELISEIRRVEGVLSARIDHLDRDVGAIIRREYPDPPAA